METIFDLAGRTVAKVTAGCAQRPRQPLTEHEMVPPGTVEEARSRRHHPGEGARCYVCALPRNSWIHGPRYSDVNWSPQPDPGPTPGEAI